jgi:hypothetical protein
VNIADISASVSLYLETGKFEAEAAKEGEKTGASMGATMSAKVQTSLSKVAAAGIGLEIGKQMLHGLESAFSAVANVIPDMLSGGQAFALNVHDIAVKTGASAEATSRFAGTLKYLGINTEGLGMSLKTLSQNLVKNEGAMNKLGIATRDANKMPLDTITILDNLRHYLSQTADGYTKLGLAGKELGRSAGNLIEYFNLTDEQAAWLNRTLDALGVTMGGDAVAASEGLRREENLLGLAWQGLSETLAQAVVPALRQVIGGIIEFVSKHGPELRQMLADITNSVLGFATALLGVEGVTPFQMQLDALGGSVKNVTLSKKQWAQQNNLTWPTIDKTAEAVKAATTAIDNQIKSIDKQSSALSALEKQQDRTYQRGLDALNAQLDAQGKLLDAGDQKIARAQRDIDLAKGLRDAQEALDRAQLDATEAQSKAANDPSLSPTAKAQAAIDAARSVRDAEESLAQARQAIADEARTRGEEDRKGQITDVKAYLADIDKLVQDADNRKANLASLVGREKGLKAAGPAAPGSDAALELQGVLAGEKRIRQAMANVTKIDALTAKKEQLSAEASAQSSADSASITANKKKLAQLTVDYKTYLADQLAGFKGHTEGIAALVTGDPKAGTGLGGAITKAFADGQAAGETFRAWIEGPLTTAVTALVDGISKIVPAMGGIVKWITENKGTVELALILVGASTGNIAAIGAALAMSGASLNDPNSFSPIEDALGWTKKPQKVGPPAPEHPGYHYVTDSTGTGYWAKDSTAPAHASGGFIPPLTWGMTGERGPEPVFGGATGVTVFPNVSLGGQPVIVRLEIGGRPLLDYVDQNLAYRGVRRT